MIKCILYFSCLGLVVPIIFSIVSLLYENMNRLLPSLLYKIQLMIWPSSIFMMATAANKHIDFKMLIVSIVVNVILYSLIGFFVWFGIYKQKWVLFVIGVLVLLAWYKILNL